MPNTIRQQSLSYSGGTGLKSRHLEAKAGESQKFGLQSEILFHKQKSKFSHRLPSPAEHASV